MRLPRKDIVATCAVGAAVALYLLWVLDAALPGMDEVRVTTAVILALGFVASAVAVVPGFERLLHGSKAYLATTSVLGLLALVAGVAALWSANELALAVLMAALVALWLIATTHHVLLMQRARAVSDQLPAPAEQREHVGVG